MRYRNSMLGLIGVCVTAAYAPLVSAQSSQDVQLYGGYLFGDDLMKGSLSGSTPRLDDNAVFGGRYTYHFTNQWGVQLSGGYSPSRAGRVADGDENLGLTTADLDLQWNVLPNFEFGGHRLSPYVVIGGGYAWANLDRPMVGLVGNIPVAIRESNGITGNAGFGAQYYVTDHVFLGLDARYRYMNKLVSDFAQGLNTTETTLNVGYRF